MLTKSEIKYIQSLQQKKFRDEHGVFVAEGPKLLQELLLSGCFNCQSLYVVDGADALLASLPVEPIPISETELSRISGLQTPNAMLGVFEMKEAMPVQPEGKITLLLDDIQDPGNLGTIIRTADWFGIENIVASPATADCYNPKVVQSTMASLGRVNLLYADPHEWTSQHPDVPLLAATLHGEDIRLSDPPGEAILMIGNESKGIREILLQRAARMLKIPGSGQAESLNAGVAAGILLYWITGK